jgi:hypothetical protein
MGCRTGVAVPKLPPKLGARVGSRIGVSRCKLDPNRALERILKLLQKSLKLQPKLGARMGAVGRV